MSRVHSGIRVHLTLHELNSLSIYPIGTNCTSNAFFFHAEDGKIIFISPLNFNGGKLATPPLRQLTDSGIRISGGFSLLWCTFAVWCQTRTPWRCRVVWRLPTRSWFYPTKQRWREVRTSSVLDPCRRRTRSGRSKNVYICIPSYPLPRKNLTLIPEWTLFQNALYV